MKNPAKHVTWDREALRVLELFIDNDAHLYQQEQAIVSNLLRKISRGIFSLTKSYRLWQYLVDAGARKYLREFGRPGEKITYVFPAALRRHLAKAYAVEFVRKVQRGEWGPNPYSVGAGVGGAIRSLSPPTYNPQATFPPLYNPRRRRRR